MIKDNTDLYNAVHTRALLNNYTKALHHNCFKTTHWIWSSIFHHSLV